MLISPWWTLGSFVYLFSIGLTPGATRGRRMLRLGVLLCSNITLDISFSFYMSFLLYKMKIKKEYL
jgi:hypothetical protein